MTPHPQDRAAAPTCSAAHVFDPWFGAAIWASVLASPHASAASCVVLQHQRLRDLLLAARDGSPWWRRRLRGARLDADTLPQLLHSLPPMSRAELNDCFDVAVTDRSVTLPDARDFARDGGLHAEAFLGRYLVWESSGSSGEPALFVHDSHSLAVGDALQLLRGPVAGMAGLLAGARIAFVGAIDGPFASIVSLQRQRLLNPWVALTTRPFSFLQPIAGLVDELNRWQPRVLASYPSMARVLADQQRRGSLRLALRAVWTGGETLTPCCRRAIGQAFACPVWDSYGASECLEIASECTQGAMHLNADWVILEPVDDGLRPLPVGATGATTLLTNLANRVQPIVRYDIGDRVRCLPGPCACGSSLPVIEVHGRADDVLELPAADGRPVLLAPLALTTVLEDQAGLFDFCLEQHGRALRLQVFGQDAATAVGARAARALQRFLREQGVAPVRLQVRCLADRVPRGRSGKQLRVHRSA